MSIVDGRSPSQEPFPGLLRSGDIATVNEEGYVLIGARLKDAIKTGGEWISSLRLESMLSQHEATCEVAVFGAPDEKWGERSVPLIVLKASLQPST